MASAGYEQPDAGSANEISKYRQLMRLPTVHLTALFCFIYVGTEVTLGGEYIDTRKRCKSEMWNRLDRDVRD